MVSVISCLAECNGACAFFSGVAMVRMRRRWCQVAKYSTGLATSAGKGVEFVVDPGFGPGEVGILIGEEFVVDEQGP